MASSMEISSSSSTVNNNNLEQQPQGSSEVSSNFFNTSLNVLNALSGVGILSTPFALASGGWLSLIFFLIIAIIGYYCAVLLRRMTENDPTHQIGILGVYLMFGQNLRSQITLNLPTSKISSKIAIYTAVVTPLTKYALIVRPILEIPHKRFKYQRPLRMLVSTTLLISSTIIALCLPFFGDLMSLVGAFFALTSSIIIPCLCYVKISESYKTFTRELVIAGGLYFWLR
ncbi:Transmembrane amino acid transporter family protein [Euphorbia peplus]|nr:Transmembrane amino acid transporter family protein [Euphorbia peplus]